MSPVKDQQSDSDEFKEYKRLILQQLGEIPGEFKTLHARLDTMNSTITGLCVEVGKLQVRAGITGALAGLIGGIAVVLIALAKALL